MSTPSSPSTAGADSRLTAAPYALPRGATSPAAPAPVPPRMVVGPYVPAPWRGKPPVDGDRGLTPSAAMPPAYPTPAYFTPLASVAQDGMLTPDFEIPAILDTSAGLLGLSLVEPGAEPVVASIMDSAQEAPSLPWIDAFLSSTPAIPMRAVSEESSASYTPPGSEAIVDEAVASEWPMTQAAPEAPTPSDAWALDEAAEQMRALADELRDHEGIASGPNDAVRLFDASAAPEPLPAWSDDDMIDIMPLRKASSITPEERAAATPVRQRTPIATAAIEPWADRARRVGDESSEAAARALETLARRVREGEISLAGYEPRLGDAAALAAALAALLGVRR